MVKIVCPDNEKLNMSLVVNNNETVRDVIKVISLKIKGINEKYYRLKLAKQSDKEALERRGVRHK